VHSRAEIPGTLRGRVDDPCLHIIVLLFFIIGCIIPPQNPDIEAVIDALILNI
jgi:hypothetical protein